MQLFYTEPCMQLFFHINSIARFNINRLHGSKCMHGALKCISDLANKKKDIVLLGLLTFSPSKIIISPFHVQFQSKIRYPVIIKYNS